MDMLYVMILFLCELSSCLISVVRVALCDSECVVWVCWLCLGAWRKIDSLSHRLNSRSFLIKRQQAQEKKPLKGRPYSVFKQT